MVPASLEGSPKLVNMSDPHNFQIIASMLGLEMCGNFFVPLKKKNGICFLEPSVSFMEALWPSQPAVLGAPIPGIKPLGWGVPHETLTPCSLG